VEFLVQNGKLLTLVKPEKAENHLVKIFDIGPNFQRKLKYVIPTEDEDLIGHL